MFINILAFRTGFLAAVALAAPAFAQNPVLSSVSPASGLEVGGTSLTLTGTNLDLVDVVLVGGLPAENVVVLDASTVACNVPAGAPGLVDVIASSPAGDAPADNSFTYLPAVAAPGSAVRLDGVNDIVSWGHIAAQTAHTLEVWVLADATANAVIVGQLSGPSDWCGHGTSLGAAAGGYYYDVNPAGCGTGGYMWGTPLQPDIWIHLAGTYDGSDQRFYVNGQLVSQTTGNVIGPSTWLMAGAVQFANGTQQAFAGAIDELRFWDHPRSSHEIRDGMKRRLLGSEPGLVGYWRFDEGSGQVVSDLGPSGFDGWLGSGGGVDSRDPAWIASGAPIWEAQAGQITSYCAGDGSGTACPCGNEGALGHGCATSSHAGGALLGLVGWPSVGGASAALRATSSTPGQPGLFFQALDAANAGMGSVFGDGLRCAVGSVVRLQVAVADAAGAVQSTGSMAAMGAVSPGDTRRYQWWFRDPQQGPCGAGFNLSNGVELTWAP